MSESPIRIALTTVDSREAADKLATALVERNLAACVNLVGPIQSIYRWQGAIERSAEFLLIIKTGNDRLADLQNAIEELHSYDTPEFLVFSTAGASDRYTQWLLASLAR